MSTNSWYDSINEHFFSFKPTQSSSSIWLKDPEFFEHIGKQIDYNFEHNTNQTAASTRCEAFNAFVRGQRISYTNSKHKASRVELEQLEKQIKETEEELFKNSSNSLSAELNKLRARNDVLSVNKASQSLQSLRQAFYGKQVRF